MARRRDPVEAASEESTDLYDVSTWEPRSRLDRFAYAIYTAINYGLQTIVLAVAFAITVALLVQPALLVLEEGSIFIAVFFGLSVVPAAILAAFIWYSDITTNEPLTLLVATFVLAVLFATFAAVVNSLFSPSLQALGSVGMILFFYLIVGPVEETVKLLAVRFFAYRSEAFDAVIDGAVYGAVAGLGFAAIENTLYISGAIATADGGLLTVAAGTTTVRALVGPGHVIYSAIAGYYLGLAKFNPEHAGSIVTKGLLIAAFIHGTYNVTVGIVPELITGATPLPFGAAFIGYVVLFDLAIGAFLYRKIARYRRAFRAVRDDTGPEPQSEPTEFDPPGR
ncbi:PrsW family intramembrane metalloprotease [Haloterrigena sp. SYSU A558-1]|uniref:PrsW family intramembrane metalloprotease n=1 Tax=Haloterrigena gelatinilytica TaxID=2741724 RepID=A0ABX2LLS0_9EURY|nr:PrsW family intramembrane metalloprotease [Haloterrigena gelatinilytica]NUC74597.1 PrsW family intramembrane metalloprotease [Haloterrigena gelatinilytica]